MAELSDKLAERGVSKLTDDDLRGNDIKVVKCRACSGYGACGYKTFFLYDGTPYSVCNLRLEKVRNGELKELREIAQKANGLGMHDWVLENLNGYADTRTIDAAIEAGNWGWLGDHVWQFEDELQEKIARAAARQENWQWLSTYAEQISLENCADEIAIAAYKAEAHVLAKQIAEHCMSDEQREKLADAAVAADDYEYLRQLADILTPEYIGRVLVANAQQQRWDRVAQFVGSADADSIVRMMELAIAEGNFDAIDLLDDYL